ncbi:MAG: glycosyl transferase [Methylophilales bacterium 28-44-11]|nr:MAG: glycosyl transferase [Methylophilales bacterium 28-44-11]
MVSSRLTVVQMLPALASGGVERGTLEVGAYLSANGHRSIVISAGGRMVKKLLEQGSEHVEWTIGKKSIFTIKLVSRLRKFLEKEHVDILHVRSRFPAWIAYLTWKEMDPKTRPAFVTTVHGPYSVSGYSAVMIKGERVIVISEMIRDYVTSQYEVDSEKLRLIYRGVDADEFPYQYQPKPSWLKTWYYEYPKTLNTNILVLPARVTKWKGHEDFIDLVIQLRKHTLDFHALIVGEVKKGKSGYLKKLEKKVKDAGMSDIITFVGHRDDLREIMAISKIVYSLSLEPEAFGRTTLEALSLGIPVIGYSHGGVSEQLAAILPEGRIDLGNVAEAAMLTLSWLHKPPQVAMSQTFSLQQMLEKTMAVYRELAEQRQQGSAG